MNTRANAGDTIVEVLVAIAIVSLVLGGAFAATRRSQLTTQRTEERSFAIKLLETQAERLKLAGANAGSQVYTSALNASLCINDALNVVPGPCPPSSPDDIYRVQVLRRDTNNTFEVRVDWERLGGEGGGGLDENVVTFYRVHPES